MSFIFFETEYRAVGTGGLKPLNNCQTVAYFLYKSVVNEKECNGQHFIIVIFALWMCNPARLKKVEMKRMHFSVQELKSSQSMEQLPVIHIDVHSKPRPPFHSFPMSVTTALA